MPNQEILNRIRSANQLIQRIERISADSVWAHRSSGYRGSLLRWIDQAETSLQKGQALSIFQIEHYETLIGIGLRMLAGAARENIQKRQSLHESIKKDTL